MTSHRLIACILLTGSLLAGLGFCAFLPPFEGFDETAHYSYIQQIAETGTWPRPLDPMSAEIDDYLDRAPAPVAGRWSYRTFFQAPAAVRSSGENAVHGARDSAKYWTAGRLRNWEGQHPPLYYALLAPLWTMSKNWSVYRQIVLLRMASYVLAWAALVIATVLAFRTAEDAFLCLAPGLWPVLFPMWFPEMARLGNDSLIALLAALASVVLHRALRGNAHDFGLLGVLSGLMLLTKATALPFVGALFLYFAYRAWRGGTSSVRHSVIFCLACAAVAGWWYLENLMNYGNIIVSVDNMELARQGGLWPGLAANFSLSKSVVGILGHIRSFVWTGTWSFVFLPRALEIPVSLLIVIVAAGFLGRHRNMPLSATDGVALLTLGLFAIAFLYHMLVFIALYSAFSPGSWYVHSFAALLAPLVGGGLCELKKKRWSWWPTSALVIYTLVFFLLEVVFHAFYFSGCLAESPTDHHYTFATMLACDAPLPELMRRLKVLGAPAVAMTLLAAGWLTICAGTAMVLYRASAGTSSKHLPA